MGKKRKPQSIEDQLRHAIEASGLTHYRIAKDAGLAPDSVARFVSGERPDIRISTVNRLCEVLVLELRTKGR